MYEEVGETGRSSAPQDLLPGIGGVKDGLRAADREKPGVLLAWLLRDASEGRLLAMDGRWFAGLLGSDSRIALPWLRQARASILFFAGLFASSHSWTTCSISGGGDGNPSSSQYVCSTV